mgnify:CR=1 FL=1
MQNVDLCFFVKNYLIKKKKVYFPAFFGGSVFVCGGVVEGVLAESVLELKRTVLNLR